MAKLYYIDSSGKPQTADLSIIASGCHCERDVLGNMDIASCGNVHLVRGDESDCESDLERGAMAAEATYYADDAEAAQWWIDYVAGYNATQDECEELRGELRSMDADTLDAIADEYLGAERNGKLRPGDEPEALIEALHGDCDDYEMERSVFVANRDELRTVINKVLACEHI